MYSLSSSPSRTTVSLPPLGKLTSQWNEFAQPVIAQEKPCPDQHAKNDRKVERFADAHMGSGCAAKIGCQQDRTQGGSTRNRIDDRTDEQEDSDANSQATTMRA